jgi:Transposase
LEHRTLGQIDAIGVDEIQYAKGHRYLTLVYQIDIGLTRLLWVGKEPTIESFQGFFSAMGQEANDAPRLCISSTASTSCQICLVREICGSLIRSDRAGKLGSRGPASRLPDAWGVSFFEARCLSNQFDVPGKRYVVSRGRFPPKALTDSVTAGRIREYGTLQADRPRTSLVRNGQPEHANRAAEPLPGPGAMPELPGQ